MKNSYICGLGLTCIYVKISFKTHDVDRIKIWLVVLSYDRMSVDIIDWAYSCLITGCVTKSNTTGAIYAVETAYPYGALELTPSFSGVRVVRTLVLWVVFCRSLFVGLYFIFCIVCPSNYGF